MSSCSQLQHMQSGDADADGLIASCEMPSAASRRHRQVKLLILAVVACLAFQLGRKSERSRQTNLPLRELSDAQLLLHASRRSASAVHVKRKKITAFVGVQVTAEAHKYSYDRESNQTGKLIAIS